MKKVEHNGKIIAELTGFLIIITEDGAKMLENLTEEEREKIFEKIAYEYAKTIQKKNN